MAFGDILPVMKTLSWKRLPLVISLGCLLLILVPACMFRFVGIGWDQGQHQNPDERHLTMVTNDIKWPESFSQYLDENLSPMNPRNRASSSFHSYGTLPTTLVKGLCIVFKFNDYDRIPYMGRAVSGIFDIITLLFVFLLGRALYRDDRIALLGAFLYGNTVLAIQYGHFYIVDSFTTTFITASLYFLVRAQRSSRLRDWLPAGICFGGALACKLSIFVYVIVLAAVVFEMFLRKRDVVEVLTEEEEKKPSFPRPWKIVLGVLLCGFAGYIVLRLGMPDGFAHPQFWRLEMSPRWMTNMQEVRRIVDTGEGDVPYTRQWVGRSNYWFPLWNMVVWGMGPALGLLVWAGWAYAVWRMFKRGEWHHLPLVLWSILVFLHAGGLWVKTMRYFLPIYPSLVVLGAWFAVQSIDRAAECVKPAIRRLASVGAYGLVGLVVLLTFGWALAFTNIYSRPHSRVEASRYMYANMPTGTVIATEHWDDALPLSIDGKNPGMVGLQTFEMAWYEDDNPGKLDRVMEWLNRADYVTLSSERLYKSIPRMPNRFPMTTAYYEALFDGRLGFEMVGDYTSYPSLFGHRFNDDNAEEAFSVYDHPHARIFKKTKKFDPVAARKLLQDALESRPIVLQSGLDANRAPDLTMFSEKDWNTYKKVSAAIERKFDPAGWANRYPVLAWALVLEIIGLCFWPILFLATRGLHDRGWALSRTIGLLIVAWGTWMVASFRWAPFTPGLTASVLVAMGAVGVLFAWKQRTEIGAFLKQRWDAVLWTELAFWAAFLGFVLIRYCNPDLWNPWRGGEKPMDFAYLNAVIRTPFFPPYDPWFSGGYINYYYFGYVLVAVMVKLTGIAPGTAYNLAVPMFFALTASGAGCVAATLALGIMKPKSGDDRSKSHRRAFGGVALLLGILFVVLLGNLGEARLIFQQVMTFSRSDLSGTPQLVQPVVRAVDGLWTYFRQDGPFGIRPEGWYWDPSRAIAHPNTEAPPITECPFFTFLFADLHPHMMALPLTLALLGLGVSWVRGGGGRMSRLARAIAFGSMGLLIGALWPTNAWDFPTCLVIAGVAFVCDEWRRGSYLRGCFRALAPWLIVIAWAVLSFYPFRYWYRAGYTSAELWKGSRTTLGDYLIVHGVFIFFLLGFFWYDFRTGKGHNLAIHTLQTLCNRMAHPIRAIRTILRYRRRMHLVKGLAILFLVTVFLVGIVSWFVSKAPYLFISPENAAAVTATWEGGAQVASKNGSYLPAFLVALLCINALLAIRRRPQPMRQFALAMIGLALCLCLTVEYIVLKGDISRMNTVFKFYLQVWVLMGTVGAAASCLTMAYLWRKRSLWQFVWWPCAILLVFCAFLYTIFGTWSRVSERYPETTKKTLDGESFMQTSTFPYQEHEKPISIADDAKAMEWIKNNVPGIATLAEVNTAPILYGWGTRMAIHTGKASIVGWDWHQRQQRAAIPGNYVSDRMQMLQLAYTAMDPKTTWDILHRLKTDYIVAGDLERAYYGDGIMGNLERGNGTYWNEAYRNDHVRIYRMAENVAGTVQK
jgi:uncharacterized membrane protein